MPHVDSPPLEFANVSWRERLLLRVAAGRGVWLVAAVACALALPSLAIGLSTDDTLNVLLVQRGGGVTDFFRIAPERLAAAVQLGEFSWWTNPELSIRFFRPLSALTHYLEYRLYPSAAWAMHLVNVLLYVALAAVAWRVYRLLLPSSPRTAAVAALLFAVDDGHAPTLGWISGRNTLLASLFALCALWFHALARRGTRAWPAALASAGCVALALASAEAGLAVFAYLIAYAVAFETASLRRRALSLLPALGVFLVWAALYIAGGYGTRGAALYRDLSTPLSTLGQGLADLPTWLFSLLGPSAVTTTLILPAAPVRLVCTLVVLPLVAALYLGLPRRSENAFFALGALLCLPPLFTTQPQDRLLALASFGGFGLLASFFAAARHSGSAFVRGSRRTLFALHAVISPLLFAVMVNPNAPVDNGARALAAAVPRTSPAQVVLVQLPMELLPLYGWPKLLAERDRLQPQSMLQLYGGGSALIARRSDAQTLELYAADSWGHLSTERVFASLASLPRAGDERTVSGISIRVLESDAEGRPRRVQFRFPDALEGSDRLWLTWRGTRPELWQPPAIGTEVALPALNPFRALPL